MSVFQFLHHGVTLTGSTQCCGGVEHMGRYLPRLCPILLGHEEARLQPQRSLLQELGSAWSC